MLVECFKILLAGAIGMAIVVPAVVLFDKWKKEMNAEEDK